MSQENGIVLTTTAIVPPMDDMKYGKILEIAKCVERGSAAGEPIKIIAATRLTFPAGYRPLWTANVKPMAEPGQNAMT